MTGVRSLEVKVILRQAKREELVWRQMQSDDDDEGRERERDAKRRSVGRPFGRLQL